MLLMGCRAFPPHEVDQRRRLKAGLWPLPDSVSGLAVGGIVSRSRSQLSIRRNAVLLPGLSRHHGNNLFSLAIAS